MSLVMVSHAPLPKIEAFKKRMGWHFPWVSSLENSFNHDFHVYFTPQERASGDVYYSMRWVRHHDRYEGGGFADPDRPYWPKTAAAEGPSSCCGSEKNE